MWDDDEFDPDSASDLAAIMEALDDAENGTANSAPQGVGTVVEAPVAVPRRPAIGHSQICDGPPSLHCTLPWGAMLLADAMPGSHQLAAFEKARGLLPQIEVRVNWHRPTADDQYEDDMALRSCKLVVRRGGREIASVSGGAPSTLSVTFDASAASPGETFVAELSWASGSRTLHVLAPLCDPLPLQGLLSRRKAPPELTGAPLPSTAWLLAPWHARSVPTATIVAPPSLPRLPDRAFGIEIEMLTWSPDPVASGCFSKMEELHAVIGALLQRAATAQEKEGGEECDQDASRLRALLARVSLWAHEVDDHVAFASEEIARRTVATNAPLSAVDVDAITNDDDAVKLLAGGAGTMKSEFKSPIPAKGALNFARSGAEEIATFFRLVRHLGCGAPALSATGNGGGSLHVHVNVCDPTAGGSPLSVDEILYVYLSWVRFDGVTARFARPWTWREPSMAPLYASGTEFIYREKAWEQGGEHATVSHEQLATYDVPRFVAAVRALMHAPGWVDRSEGERLEMLFGGADQIGKPDGSPASQIGRYCSMNLRRLTSYGTLEIRRFHSCIDPAVVGRWAHFCVSFVEAFRGGGDGLARRVLSLELPLAAALSELQAAQEAATPTELMAAMAGHVDPRTASVLMHDSGAVVPPAAVHAS